MAIDLRRRRFTAGLVFLGVGGLGALAGGRGQLPGLLEGAGSGGLDQGGGGQEQQIVAGCGPVDDPRGGRRVAADELADQRVGIGSGHGTSIGSGADAGLTLG